MANIHNLISSVPLFSGLDENMIQILNQSLFRKTFQTGEIIIWEGDVSTELFIIWEGWLKVVKTSATGREMILNVLGPGDIFNTMAAFIKIENPATVIAFEDCVLYSLKYETLIHLMDGNPEFSRRILGKIATRLHQLTEMIGDLSLLLVEARLADLLISRSDGKIYKRKKWLTQAEMAALIGTVPDVVNRLLNTFVEK